MIGSRSTAVFSSPEAYTVEAITLTSTAEVNTKITSVAIFGADDNGEWLSLGEWRDLSFEWDHYTRPFLLKTVGAFKHYKLEMNGIEALAELELLGE